MHLLSKRISYVFWVANSQSEISIARFLCRLYAIKGPLWLVKHLVILVDHGLVTVVISAVQVLFVDHTGNIVLLFVESSHARPI